VRVLKMIKHPNIVLMHEVFKRKGRFFLIFEYLDNNLLECLEEREDGIEPELVKSYIYQLLKAIEY
jgi:cyclin-dependent kinase-like